LIVAEDNPLDDLSTPQRLTVRIKDGRVLHSPEPAADQDDG